MENLIKVFTGPEASALLLKSRLEETGIDALIKNDASDAFFGVTPQVVDLYIEKEKFTGARVLIQDIIMSLNK